MDEGKFSLSGVEYSISDLNEEQKEMLAGIATAQKQVNERTSELQLMELAMNVLTDALTKSLDSTGLTKPEAKAEAIQKVIDKAEAESSPAQINFDEM
jgi:hypothetical protein